MRSRQPVSIKAERSPADVVLGILAILALLGLIAGVPYALLRFFESPIPAGGISLDLLTRPAGLSTVLGLLSLLVWLAWIQLVACVLIELWAGVRNVGVPARVPFAGGPQAIAHRLVTAALLLFTAAAVVSPIVSAAAKPAAPAVVSVVAHHDAVQEKADSVLSPVKKTKKVYVVQPPHGRHHESLWEIADKCLGDGRRYKEIYQLNQHKEQPDGTKLHMADLIRPGWVMDMPDDAINVHTVPIDEHRPAILHDHPGQPSSLDGHTQQYDQYVGDAADDPESTQEIRLRTRMNKPDTMLTRPATQDVRQAMRDAGAYADKTGADKTGADDGGQSAAIGLPDFVAAASLAAAGLLAALGHRRRQQLWGRAFGRRLPEPEGDAALAEMALLLGADSRGSRLLDLGLRHLNRELAARGRTPPTVYGAFLAPGNLDLWIHPADTDAPAPWTALDNGSVWRLSAGDGHRLSEEAVADTLAPYPGLVSLGVNESGRVLVDLEAAHGLINVRGRPHIVAAALAAVAVELATNRWSDHMRLILVGFGADLALIAPDRITVVANLAEALPKLEERTEEVRQALAAAGAESVLTGRCRGVYGEAWMPTYLLSAVPPTPEEAARLAELAKTGTRLASGYLVAGDGVPSAAWTWELTPDGRAGVKALGLEVRGQLLPEQQYSGVIDLFRQVGPSAGVPLPAPEASGPVAAQLHPAFRPSVEVRLLGRIEVIAPRQVEEERLPICAEMVSYLATHPDGVHPRVLGGALWPRGVEASVRDATISRTEDWLGTDSAGRPNLLSDTDGRLRLGPEVRTDWQVFRELVRLARADLTAEAANLDRALGLVRGPLLEGRPGGRFLWLAGDPLTYEVSARVTDAAHRLAELRMGGGDARGAVDAALAGLRLSDDDELLWRDLLRASHATGDMNAVRHWVGMLHGRAASSRFRGRLMPETGALIDELLPTPTYQEAAR